ncbi:virulence promoting factor [Salmonella enterica subsp. enterica]|nr:virulence promoting factor [Salmonella enterica subsp. enterica]
MVAQAEHQRYLLEKLLAPWVVIASSDCVW